MSLSSSYCESQKTSFFDVIVIGAGAVGCAIARELSQFELSVAVLEKESDVAAGTSGRNSGVVHAGFNNRLGSLMAELCVEGNRGFEQLCATLDVPYRKTGKLLVAFDEEDLATLERIIETGRRNGCQGLRLLSGDELHGLMPQVGGIGGMLSPETAIFNPFLYTVALAENAAINGVLFYFDSEVTAIERTSEGFLVHTDRNAFSSRFLVNSAGLFADRIAAMAGVEGFRVFPCRGEYHLLDVVADDFLPLPVYPVPKPGIGGLGVHLTPTIEGNVLIGPSAEYIDARDDYACTSEVMAKMLNEAYQLLPGLDGSHVIGNYSGIRPKLAPPEEGGFQDFIIEEDPRCPGLINLIGIESPGLTASAPIAHRVRGLLSRHLELKEKCSFKPRRAGITRFRDCSPEEQARLIEADPDYGEIVCRCQKVTKHELREAIENPLGVRSISAIKYRAWATTGRCNGGYCLPKIAALLVEEYGISPDSITYRGIGGELFTGSVK